MGQRMDLVRSLDLATILGKIDDDVMLDFAQYSLLREAADAKLYHLMSQVQGRCSEQLLQDMEHLHQACAQVSRLLQSACLALRRLDLDAQGRRLAREALESQLAYPQACLRRSLTSFDPQA